MSFRWQIPNPPPDPDAIDRMKGFHKPRDPMPEAWFMHEKIKFFTWLQDISPQKLMKEGSSLEDALSEIQGGLISFPEVRYVKEWKEWFLYLLPYMLTDAEFYIYMDDLLYWMIPTLFAIYPDGIVEEYKGYRHDLVYTVGNYFLPPTWRSEEYTLDPSYPILSLDWDTVNEAGTNLPSLWDKVNSAGTELPSLYQDFSLSMLFCLKYLMPDEIETWVESMISIGDFHWHVAILRWRLAFHQFLERAKDWPQDGDMAGLFEELKELYEETGPLQTARIRQIRFKSLDAFLPRENLAAFQAAFTRYLTLDRFQTWATNIKTHGVFELRYTKLTIDELGEYYRMSFEGLFQDFEVTFFGRSR